MGYTARRGSTKIAPLARLPQEGRALHRLIFTPVQWGSQQMLRLGGGGSRSRVEVTPFSRNNSIHGTHHWFQSEETPQSVQGKYALEAAFTVLSLSSDALTTVCAEEILLFPQLYDFKSLLSSLPSSSMDFYECMHKICVGKLTSRTRLVAPSLIRVPDASKSAPAIGAASVQTG